MISYVYLLFFGEEDTGLRAPALRRAARRGVDRDQGRAAGEGPVADRAVLRQADLRQLRTVLEGSRADGCAAVGDGHDRHGRALEGIRIDLRERRGPAFFLYIYRLYNLSRNNASTAGENGESHGCFIDSPGSSEGPQPL